MLPPSSLFLLAISFVLFLFLTPPPKCWRVSAHATAERGKRGRMRPTHTQSEVWSFFLHSSLLAGSWAFMYKHPACFQAAGVGEQNHCQPCGSPILPTAVSGCITGPALVMFRCSTRSHPGASFRPLAFLLTRIMSKIHLYSL